LVYLQKIIESLKLMFLQGTLVDLVFSATFNLQGSFDLSLQKNDPYFLFSKVSSLLALSLILFELINLVFKALERPEDLTQLERNFLKEGILEDSFNKFKYVRIINLVF